VGGAGTVAGAEDFGENADLDHLTRAGAVREATADEAAHEQVTLPDGGPPPTALEQQLAEKDREIARLMAERAEYQDRYAEKVATEAREQDNRGAGAHQALLEAKELRAAELQRENDELKAQLGGSAKHAAHKGK
jgi:hypothetical protein